MRFKICILSTVLFLLCCSSIKAKTSEGFASARNCINGESICMGEDLLKDVIKQTIYSVGSHLLDKYMNNGQNQGQQRYPSQQSSASSAQQAPKAEQTNTAATVPSSSPSSTTSSGSTKPTTPASPSNSNTIPGMEEEALIPVS